MKNIQAEYIEDSPTIVVTFVINEKHPENSTYLVDFDRVLRVKEDEWKEMDRKHRLMSMVDNFKKMLPSLMINRDDDFEVVEVKEN